MEIESFSNAFSVGLEENWFIFLFVETREKARGFMTRNEGEFKACIPYAETVSARGRGALFVLFGQFCSDLLC